MQNCWRCIHDNAETTFRQADITDREVARAAAEYEKQARYRFLLSILFAKSFYLLISLLMMTKIFRYVSKMTGLVSSIPEINKQVETVMKSLGVLQDLFMEVEVALLALEDTIDARDAQENQLERRFQIALYQEKRRQELEELETRLEMDYQKKMREKEKAENNDKAARQVVFQAKFTEDMKKFTETGFLEVPLTRPSDVSLESIDLDADEHGLEAFLKEDCPGVSPLPRDDVPLLVENIENSDPVSPLVNIQSPSSSGEDQSINAAQDKTEN